ncbi:MAG: hypothetical protein ABI781_14875 [Burkholderiales bacterium]
MPDPATSPLLAGQPDAALPAGMRLGAFEIQRVIARSASSVVYLATDQALAMPVAIQEFLPARLMRRDAGLRLVAAAAWHDDLIARGLRAFVDEARLLARCDHPALVRVHQLFHSHGSAYRVMPVYAGQRLSELRREMVGAPDEASLRTLLDGLLGAIEAIHRSGQVHGGVSAENILLLADDRPLLLGPGAATREMGSDLVNSLMATLESPAGTDPAAEADAGTPATGAVLDLYALAEVVRFCITAEPPLPSGVLRSREPLASVIARQFPAVTRPQYSAALLGALDAAVSPFAQDRPLSAAQFRDWLARGVPSVPGAGPARAKPPAAAAPPRTPPVAKPRPRAPAPVVAEAAAAPGQTATPTPPFSAMPSPPRRPPAPPAPAADEPLAPWPDFARAVDPPPTLGQEIPGPAPFPPQLQRLTKARQRRYKWLFGTALALLAVVVLAIATGAWNRAPEIPLGPEAERIGTSPLVGSTRATVDANAPTAAPPTSTTTTTIAADPARALAAQPPAAGATPPVRAARAIAAPIPNPTAGPRAACSGRTEFALYRCMLQQCQLKRWMTHPQCVKLRLDDRVD